MKLKKKIILMANVMLCAALSCACGKEGTNQKDSNKKWKDAYKENLRNMESYLANVFQKSDEYIPVEDLDFNAVEW